MSIDGVQSPWKRTRSSRGRPVGNVEVVEERRNLQTRLESIEISRKCEEKMVIDLPMVSCKDGVCFGHVVSIIEIVSIKMPLGMLWLPYNLCTVTYVVLF